jgi:hypothetical protein
MIEPRDKGTMDRKAIVTEGLDMRGRGLEIGPSHNPVTPKRDGYNVVILDYQSTDELRAKYLVDGIDVSSIEEVDYIWRGEPYAQLLGGQRFAWIIASHVIEHVPDLIGFLQGCTSVLTDDGVISLVIPDRRYSFDYHRPITSIGSVIDAHLEGRTQPSVGTAVDYYLNVVRREGAIAWYKGFQGDEEFVHGFEEAKLVSDRRDPFAVSSTFDPHVWCFVPHAFRLLIEDLFQLGYLQVRERSFRPTVATEFYLQLSRSGPGLAMSRLEALDQIDYELGDDSYRLPDGFDRERYLELNPDVVKAQLDPVFHWLTYGAIEGRRYR